jgi:prepilin-type N-terminal cleavage/methylation domain-containing protein
VNRSRGFTVVELMIALALSAVILAAAAGVFSIVGATDQRLRRTFDEISELSIAQRVIRRATSSLVAAKPQDETNTARTFVNGKPVGENQPNPDEKDPGEGEEQNQDEGEQTSEQDPLAVSDALATNGRPDLRARFELYYQLGTSAQNAEPIPALELVVLESPAPGKLEFDPTNLDAAVTQFLPVRGVFETIELEDGLALQWRPIEPAGESTLLVTGLERVEWWVLPADRAQREWVDVWAALIAEDFPVATRLLMWKRGGTHIDWLFDLSVITPD